LGGAIVLQRRKFFRAAAMPQIMSGSRLRLLLPHVAMGANLGAICALTLIVMQSADIQATLSDFAAPKLAILTFVLTTSLLFAAGAGITGLAMSRHEAR
jgi:hypothetical protein